MGFFDALGKIVLFLLVVALVLGYLNYTGVFSNLPLGSPEVRRASPYQEKVLPDIEMRKLASSWSKECPSASKECQVNSIFRTLVTTYAYYSDPRNTELIQSPAETVSIQGGDCEDLSILLNSLLESIGIHTLLVLTDDHAYSLACGLDSSILRQYVEQDILEQVAKEHPDYHFVFEDGNLFQKQDYTRILSIPAHTVQYYGGEGERLTAPFSVKQIDYSLQFTQPIDVYIVEGKEEYRNLAERKSFQAYDCTQKHVLSTEGSCKNMKTDSGIAFVNDQDTEVIAHVSITSIYAYSPAEILANVSITSYPLENESCVVLDATSGKYGYPGYQGADLLGRKVAVDGEKIYVLG